MKILIIWVLFFSLFVYIASCSINIPADVQEIFAKENPGAYNAGAANIGTPYQQSSEGGGTSSGNGVPGQNEAIKPPVIVKKNLFPANKASYLVNNTLKIKVEIQLTGDDLNIQN